MLQEVELLSKAERYVIERKIIDEIALPVGDRYGDDVFTDYFDCYAGLARKYRPKRIYEIGVRYGYTAIVFMMGLRANRGAPKAEYLGIDDESYHFGSCAQANANFAQMLPGYNMRAMKFNSFHGTPTGIGTFDLCHIDGNHDYHGVANDLLNVWPLVNPGGIVVLDDAAPVDDRGNPGPIYTAIQDFLSQFEYSEELVEWQYIPNLRGHFIIRKCA